MGYLDNTGLAYLWGKIKAKIKQSDWQQNDETAPDYVKNRPGGYDVRDVNITWDGEIEDKVVVAVSGPVSFVKVSDRVLTVDEINGLTVETSTGIKRKISHIASEDTVLIDLIAFVSTPGYVDTDAFPGLTFSEPGIYFNHVAKEAQTLYTASLTSAPTPVKIPQKYLDLDGYAQEADAILSTPQTLTEEQKQQARENIGADQSPVKVEILETICENYESTQASNVLTFDTPITLDADALYYLDYQYYNGTTYQASNSMQGFSRVKTDASGLTRVIWLSEVSTNRLTLTANSLTDTWVGGSPQKAIVSIYKVQVTVNDSIAEVFEQHDAKGFGATASGSYSYAHGFGATASGYCSFAHGTNATASGDYSFAHGANATASGYCSFVRGHGNTANNAYSHAIGQACKATGDHAFALVWGSTASGNGAFSCSFNGNASGGFSFAANDGAKASGDRSFAEGMYCEASGNFSHAAGYYTIAAGAKSFAQGQYNVKNTDNTLAHIVGNGTSETERSNAHTLDWSGNAWFAGDVYVGSTSGKNKDGGSKKLATEDDLAAKADKPTTTEATLLASGWTGDSAPYTYTLSVTGVTADSHQEFCPGLDITTAQLTALQAANIQDGGQAEGTVTLKAFGTKPTIDLPIRVLH